MELLKVVCGNGLERGLGPLHIPEPTSLAMTNSEGNPSLPPSLLLLWICGWVQQWEVTCGRLWFMWWRVRVRRSWAGGGEKMDPRRDWRRQSDYSLLPPFIFIFNTRRFTRSFTHVVSLWLPKASKKPSQRPGGQCRDGRVLKVFTFERKVIELHPLT